MGLSALSNVQSYNVIRSLWLHKTHELINLNFVLEHGLFFWIYLFRFYYLLPSFSISPSYHATLVTHHVCLVLPVLVSVRVRYYLVLLFIKAELVVRLFNNEITIICFCCIFLYSQVLAIFALSCTFMVILLNQK